ncbi:NAC transcription factor NAM-2-like protein [Corchorus capsularis]|uniref:NAC transcription factor NAM-2-like protein n=1 Tax=Corchorus capsularis TaxID=210143 RepID=A0A1R3GYL8_COCAP|nr:NAC transcription factor NAM-2-like protein [Corchorus capsularis]
MAQISARTNLFQEEKKPKGILSARKLMKNNPIHIVLRKDIGSLLQLLKPPILWDSEPHLSFYDGNYPHGTKTGWKIHEYQILPCFKIWGLEEEGRVFKKLQILQDLPEGNTSSKPEERSASLFRPAALPSIFRRFYEKQKKGRQEREYDGFRWLPVVGKGDSGVGCGGGC